MGGHNLYLWTGTESHVSLIRSGWMRKFTNIGGSGLLDAVLVIVTLYIVYHRRRSHILGRGTCPSSFESEGTQKGSKI